MLRRERGQVTAEYAGMLLVVAVIVGALVVAGPAQRIAGEAVRAICQIAGGQCGAPPVPAVDRQALQGAVRDLEGVIARHADSAAVAAFFTQLDPNVAEALAHERPELVGNLDGAPIGLRYRANAEAIRDEIARLRADGVARTTRVCASCASSTTPTATSCSSTRPATAAQPRCSATSPARVTSRLWCRA